MSKRDSISRVLPGLWGRELPEETAPAIVLVNAVSLSFSGVVYCVTDVEGCYNCTVKERVKCLFHQLRSRARLRKRVEQLGGEA